jgi:two-component system LytT family response regulator
VTAAAPTPEPLRTLVVDDESLARRGLRLRLDALPDVEVVAEARNGREALAAVQQHDPDLMFLDIQMPGMDGFDVIRELQADHMPLIVFVTAFDHYAVNAFEVRAIDYVLKPVEPERIEHAVRRAREQRALTQAESRKGELLQLVSDLTGRTGDSVEALLENGGSASYPDRITIRDGQELTVLKVDDIDWVDAAGDYMCVHARGETHVMRSTMKKLEAQLDPARFARIHRSTLINLARIQKLTAHINGEFFVSLDCGARLKLSRSYRDRIEHLL